ncbi:BQ2448_3046 [Microbotryum intermedium]|uniref:BQ2448_3046 protein n=1 Tax=Microbotryum intermedium TaxID=269621 RepID=A0A238FJW3_9BASI|nr:BQ2448_3046 [Microbotryum intermedium]
MRLKPDDRVAKSDFDVLECKLTVTIAINSASMRGAHITLDRHECAMTLVGIFPVQSSSVNAPRFNERCFCWKLTLAVESTCGCRPRSPTTSTYSQILRRLGLELTARKKGTLGGKNENRFRLKVSTIPLRGWVRSVDTLQMSQHLHPIEFHIPEITMPPIFTTRTAQLLSTSKRAHHTMKRSVCAQRSSGGCEFVRVFGFRN